MYKKVPMESKRLTTKHLARLEEDETLIVHCDTLAERDNSRQCAYYARKKCPRPDGYYYKVETSNIDKTITISLTKEQE